MEDKVLAVYVDDKLVQQYFLVKSEVVNIELALAEAAADIYRTIVKMEFEHISIWLKPIK